eukprot:7390963-Prymnesium_polylepis.2
MMCSRIKLAEICGVTVPYELHIHMGMGLNDVCCMWYDRFADTCVRVLGCARLGAFREHTPCGEGRSRPAHLALAVAWADHAPRSTRGG